MLRSFFPGKNLLIHKDHKDLYIVNIWVSIPTKKLARFSQGGIMNFFSSRSGDRNLWPQ